MEISLLFGRFLDGGGCVQFIQLPAFCALVRVVFLSRRGRLLRLLLQSLLIIVAIVKIIHQKFHMDSIDFGPKREKFHFSLANISRTRRSRGMISTPLESGFQPVSMRVEVDLLERKVLEIISKGKPFLARSRCWPLARSTWLFFCRPRP